MRLRLEVGDKTLMITPGKYSERDFKDEFGGISPAGICGVYVGLGRVSLNLLTSIEELGKLSLNTISGRTSIKFNNVSDMEVVSDVTLETGAVMEVENSGVFVRASCLK